MVRFYQAEWQNISFDSFANLSFFRLANSDFYNNFYSYFFQKYENYEALPHVWRTQKECWAKCIAEKIPPLPTPDVLSVGCGLGFVEKNVVQSNNNINMSCTEVCDTSLKWIKKDCRKVSFYIGLVPSCLPADRMFDIICCCAIDYAVNDLEWCALLRSLRKRLKPDGKLLIFTASLQKEELAPSWLSRLSRCKYILKLYLRHVIYKKRVQFWGWMRTREENVNLLVRAGFNKILIEPAGNNDSCLLFVAGA